MLIVFVRHCGVAVGGIGIVCSRDIDSDSVCLGLYVVLQRRQFHGLSVSHELQCWKTGGAA